MSRSVLFVAPAVILLSAGLWLVYRGLQPKTIVISPPSGGGNPTPEPTPRPPVGGNVEGSYNVDTNTAQPRGMRNKNPLNIEYSPANKWKGQMGSDGRFVIFEHQKWGFRAAARVLRSYQKRGINTIQGVIHTFAPSHENNSDHYANMVAKWTGYGKHSALNFSDKATAARVIKAMARMEVGHKYSLSEVMEGVALA